MTSPDISAAATSFAALMLIVTARLRRPNPAAQNSPAAGAAISGVATGATVPVPSALVPSTLVPGAAAILGGSAVLILFGRANAVVWFMARATLLSGLSAHIHWRGPASWQPWLQELAALRKGFSAATLHQRLNMIRTLAPPAPKRRVIVAAECATWLALFSIGAVAAGWGGGVFSQNAHFLTPADASGLGAFTARTPAGILTFTKVGRYSLPGAQGPLVIDVGEDSVSVVNAPCRDQRCMHQGPLFRHSRRAIICAPGEIILTWRPATWIPATHGEPINVPIRAEIHAWTG